MFPKSLFLNDQSGKQNIDLILYIIDNLKLFLIISIKKYGKIFPQND